MRTFSVFFFSAILLTSCSGDTNPDNPSDGTGSSVSSIFSSSVESSSGISSDGFSFEDGVPVGTVHVRGFAETEIVVEPFCDDDFCPEYEYVFLTITESDSQEFENFLNEYGGNAYASDNRIGLGCAEDEQIVYENDSDVYQRKEFVLSEELSRDILASTPENPVSLTLTKLPLTGGSGAPACYSHFTTVQEWDGE